MFMDLFQEIMFVEKTNTFNFMTHFSEKVLKLPFLVLFSKLWSAVKLVIFRFLLLVRSSSCF